MVMYQVQLAPDPRHKAIKWRTVWRVVWSLPWSVRSSPSTVRVAGRHWHLSLPAASSCGSKYRGEGGEFCVFLSTNLRDLYYFLDKNVSKFNFLPHFFAQQEMDILSVIDANSWILREQTHRKIGRTAEFMQIPTPRRGSHCRQTMRKIWMNRDRNQI